MNKYTINTKTIKEWSNTYNQHQSTYTTWYDMVWLCAGVCSNSLNVWYLMQWSILYLFFQCNLQWYHHVPPYDCTLNQDNKSISLCPWSMCRWQSRSFGIIHWLLEDDSIRLPWFSDALSTELYKNWGHAEHAWRDSSLTTWDSTSLERWGITLSNGTMNQADKFTTMWICISIRQNPS